MMNTRVVNHPDMVIGLSVGIAQAGLSRWDWLDCYPVIDRETGVVVGVVAASREHLTLAGRGGGTYDFADDCYYI